MVRQLPDGRLIFPNRGTPPTPAYGYEADPQDPYIHVPIYEACDHRTEITYKTSCGRLCGRKWCKLHDKEATPETCEDCPDIMLIDMSNATGVLDATDSIAEVTSDTTIINDDEVNDVPTDSGMVQEIITTETEETSE